MGREGKKGEDQSLAEGRKGTVKGIGVEMGRGGIIRKRGEKMGRNGKESEERGRVKLGRRKKGVKRGRTESLIPCIKFLLQIYLSVTPFGHYR